MNDHKSENKRIAVNTLLLYVRMIFLTIINIYTVRVTLECLGDIDYGIYEAVASVIGTMGFLTGTMTSATQRFLSFHLGKEDYEGYSHTYSMLLVCFLTIAGLLIAIGLPLGKLFVVEVLNIPAVRHESALWVYYFSVFTFALYFISIPFTAQIVANEKMGVFAYFSIADGVMKLIIVLLLLHSDDNRLVLYAGLLCAVNAVLDLIYLLYCKTKFRYCRFKYRADRLLLKKLGSYTSWNLFGSISGMLAMQGQSILLNIFFGPLANTAKGIGNRIYNVIISFATNMFMAFSPQIVKSYAAGENDRMLWLGMQSTRLSFFLLLLMSYPLMISMQSLLNLWLGSELVTPLMIRFSQLMLVFTLIQTFEPPITQMIRATGNIKEYQIKVGVWTLMYIPICILVLWLGGDPISTMIVLNLLYAGVIIVRLKVARKLVGLSIRSYIKDVVYPSGRVCVILLLISIALGYWHQIDEWLALFIRLVVCGIIAGTAIWIAGFSVSDRMMVIKFVKSKLPGY